MASPFIHDFDAPGSSVLLIGAGVSKAAPSNAPLWNELQADLISLTARNAAELGAEQPLKRLAQSLFSLLKEGGLTPEDTLSILESNVGSLPIISYLSSRLTCGAPNKNHLKVSSLARKGLISAILTTNFDEYLERALENTAIAFRVASSDAEKSSLLQEVKEDRHSLSFIPLVKLHGTAKKRDMEAEAITRTVRQILKAGRSQGLVSFAVNSELIFSRYAAGRQLQSPNEEWLAFVRGTNLKVVGYSGNDRDIWPAIYESMTLGSNIVWGVLPGSCPTLVENAARNMGKCIEIVEGDAYDFLCRIEASSPETEASVSEADVTCENWDADFLELAQPEGCLESLTTLAAALGRDAVPDLEEVCNSLGPTDCPPLVRAQCYRQLGFASMKNDTDGARGAFHKAIELLRDVADHDPPEKPVCNRLMGATMGDLGRIALGRGEIEDAIGHLKTALNYMESGDEPFPTKGEPQQAVVYRRACRDLALALVVLDSHNEAIEVAAMGLKGAEAFPDGAIQAGLRLLRTHSESAVRGGPEIDPSSISHLAPQDRWEMVNYFAAQASNWQRLFFATPDTLRNWELLGWAMRVYLFLCPVAKNERLEDEHPRVIVNVLMNIGLISDLLDNHQTALNYLAVASNYCKRPSLTDLRQFIDEQIERIKTDIDWDG